MSSVQLKNRRNLWIKIYFEWNITWNSNNKNSCSVCIVSPSLTTFVNLLLKHTNGLAVRAIIFLLLLQSNKICPIQSQRIEQHHRKKKKSNFSRHRIYPQLLTFFSSQIRKKCVYYSAPVFIIFNTLFIFLSQKKFFFAHIYCFIAKKDVIWCIVYQSQRNLLNSTNCDTFTHTIYICTNTVIKEFSFISSLPRSWICTNTQALTFVYISLFHINTHIYDIFFCFFFFLFVVVQLALLWHQYLSFKAREPNKCEWTAEKKDSQIKYNIVYNTRIWFEQIISFLIRNCVVVVVVVGRRMIMRKIATNKIHTTNTMNFDERLQKQTNERDPKLVQHFTNYNFNNNQQKKKPKYWLDNWFLCCILSTSICEWWTEN